MNDKPHEECGVFAIISKTPLPMTLMYSGLFSLQHRGQESAGIAVAKEYNIDIIKDIGLVSDVFDLNELDKISTTAAIGHVRYATTGCVSVANAQPIIVHSIYGDIALAHNGNLVNQEPLKQNLLDSGTVFETTSDSEIILHLIEQSLSMGIEKAVIKAVKQLEGAFSLVILFENQVIAVRDKLGMRPLCIGMIDDTYIVSSESCALDILGATLLRDVSPGEIITIDKIEMETIYCQSSQTAHCSFEYIYFSRPDSILDGKSVYQVRMNSGKLLYQEHKTVADLVIAVPDSGVIAAMGYSEASGIPYSIGLIRSKYMGRSFIMPNQEMRDIAIRLKLNPLINVIKGKRIVLVDDSLVRGTTAKKLVSLLRLAGALEVHLRLASPMVISECFFGIDISSKEELLAHHISTAEAISDFLGADSVVFLSIKGQKKLLGNENEFCYGCFTGEYPIKIKKRAQI